MGYSSFCYKVFKIQSCTTLKEAVLYFFMEAKCSKMAERLLNFTNIYLGRRAFTSEYDYSYSRKNIHIIILLLFILVFDSICILKTTKYWTRHQVALLKVSNLNRVEVIQVCPTKAD